MPPRSSMARSSATLPLRESAERFSNSGGPSTSYVRSDRRVKGKSSRSRLLVGIDYGTTYTSVAYAYIKDEQDANLGSLGVRLSEVQHIASWHGPYESPIVPTVTMYDSSDPSKPKWWGYKVARAIDREEAPDTANAVHLAKLLLHKARETEKETVRLTGLAQKMGKKDIDLIVDFLRQLYDYLFGDDGYFKQHHASWLDDADIDFVFGVPAAWSEPEQQAMIRAAEEAGFTKPSRCSEPEAMAASYFGPHDSSFEIGDTFVICDAGGGTVDLITYTIVELNPLRVNEASVAEGVLCGSTYLNQRIRSVLQQKLSSENYLRDLDQILDKAMIRFDEFKKDFSGTEREYFTVPGLRATKEGFQENRIWLSSDELKKKVFDPVVQQIEQIIRKQVESSRAIALKEAPLNGTHSSRANLKIKNIVLGGGFSSNKYLYDTIRRAFSQCLDPEDRIDIQRINSVGPAVAKGLVVMASRYGLVKQRRSRFSYGILTYYPYDRKIDGDREVARPVWDKFDKKEMNVKVVEWLFRKGQPIPPEMELPTMERWNYVGSNMDGMNERIFVVDMETWTVDYTPLINIPRQHEEYEITTDFDKPVDEMFERRQNKNYYIAHYDLSLNIRENNRMLWSVILKLKDGKRDVKPPQVRLLDTEEKETEILGSLVYRWANGPVKPRSQFDQKPITPRKRRRPRKAEQSHRKSPRVTGHHSPRTTVYHAEYQSASDDEDVSHIDIRESESDY